MTCTSCLGGAYRVRPPGCLRFAAGNRSNVQDLTALGATVIDLTDVKADDPTNHDKFAQLATVGARVAGRP